MQVLPSISVDSECHPVVSSSPIIRTVKAWEIINKPETWDGVEEKVSGAG